MAVLKLAFYGFAFFMFLISIATGSIPLPIGIGILVVWINLMYFSIDRASPSKKKVQIAVYVTNYLLIFYLVFNFIVYPIFESVISR
ncbi:hypothetical protein [Enterococcus sp. AZ196]|uniref:hypothetical protein n=1 Tax=Enterococcus sp. AZ196 TaxID=2774659 RepID=UPI003D2B64DE